MKKDYTVSMKNAEASVRMEDMPQLLRCVSSVKQVLAVKLQPLNASSCLPPRKRQAHK